MLSLVLVILNTEDAGQQLFVRNGNEAAHDEEGMG